MQACCHEAYVPFRCRHVKWGDGLNAIFDPQVLLFCYSTAFDSGHISMFWAMYSLGFDSTEMPSRIVLRALPRLGLWFPINHLLLVKGATVMSL